MKKLKEILILNWIFSCIWFRIFYYLCEWSLSSRTKCGDPLAIRLDCFVYDSQWRFTGDNLLLHLRRKYQKTWLLKSDFLFLLFYKLTLWYTWSTSSSSFKASRMRSNISTSSPVKLIWFSAKKWISASVIW